MSTKVDRLKAFYGAYDESNLAELFQVYATDVCFCDPITEIHGVTALYAYFANGRKGLRHCSFEFLEEFNSGQQVSLQWRMRFAHRRLKSGAEITIDGCSLITFDTNGEKVVAHRDYFDVGAMVYEHIPVVGWLVKGVKSQLNHKVKG